MTPQPTCVALPMPCPSTELPKRIEPLGFRPNLHKKSYAIFG
jgi:hypothetical protein